MAKNSSIGREKRSSYRFYLGVDGVGTKTQIALIDGAGKITAEGTSGPSNPLRVGVETAVANIAKAVDSACDIAGISRGDIVAATLGLAGVRRMDIRERIRDSFVSRYHVDHIFITTDAEIALFGTTLGDQGLVVIAGTGSVCLGQNAHGETAIAGGWGPLAGDEGGGRNIAEMALHGVAKASDGRGVETRLSEKALEYFRASSVENLLVAIYSPQMDNSRVAGFARYVVGSAIDGDELAVDIITNAGRELGSAARAVITKLQLADQKVPVGCVGSIFKAGEILTRPMAREIHKVAKMAYLTEPVMAPSHAAAFMALKSGKELTGKSVKTRT